MTTVRVHRQAITMFRAVSEHLERHPKDSILFAINYERALSDLGFTLSQGMATHLAAQLPAPAPDSDELYEAIKNGELKSPVDLQIAFGSNPTALDSVSVTLAARNTPLIGASSDSKVSSVIGVGPVKSAIPAASQLLTDATIGGFSVLLQMTEEFSNKIVKAAYESGLLKNHWEGKIALPSNDFFIDVETNYEVDVRLPKISFDTPFENGRRYEIWRNCQSRTRIRNQGIG